MQRRVELDVLRGFLLILMTVNHIPTPIRLYTNQTIGYISGAEGFIFLSAFLAGMVFTRRQEKHGVAMMRSEVRRRAWSVYVHHLFTLLFAFSVVGFFFGNYLPFYNFIWFFLEYPFKAIPASLLLVYQPPLLDILPLYVILLLITAPVLNLIYKQKTKIVLSTSISVWVLAQFNLREWLLSLVGFKHPLDIGSFNIFSWQLVWICGLALGYHVYRRQGKPLRMPAWIIVSAGVICVWLFCLRHTIFKPEMDLGAYAWLFDKWSMGPLRLINCAAVLCLVIWASPRFQFLRTWRFFAILGQNSIGVFCCHVCAAMLAVGLIEHYQLDTRTSCMILAAVISILYLYAGILSRWGKKAVKPNYSREAELYPLRSVQRLFMLCMRRSFLLSKQFAPGGESVIPVSHNTIPVVQADSEPADTEQNGDFSQAEANLVPSQAEIIGM